MRILGNPEASTEEPPWKYAKAYYSVAQGSPQTKAFCREQEGKPYGWNHEDLDFGFLRTSELNFPQPQLPLLYNRDESSYLTG